MNAALAALYGTGKTKTASDASEVDLTQISAADFLAALDESETATDGGDIDLSQMSAQELIDLSEQLDQGDETIEKMAASGELAHWDTVGRIMAHAYADEMSKVANADSDILDISELTAEQLVGALDSGEFELVELGSEKTAVSTIQAMLRAGASKKAIRAAMKMQSEVQGRSAADVISHFGGKKAAREGLAAFRKEQPTRAAARAAEKAVRQAEPGFMRTMKQRTIGSGSTVGDLLKARPGMALGGVAAGGLATGAAGAGGAAYALRRKDK